MASLSNSGWQNHKERPNRFKNNGEMVETAKCYVSSVSDTNCLGKIGSRMTIKVILEENFSVTLEC